MIVEVLEQALELAETLLEPGSLDRRQDRLRGVARSLFESTKADEPRTLGEKAIANRKVG
jgi:hypothetical protein